VIKCGYGQNYVYIRNGTRQMQFTADLHMISDTRAVV